MRSWRSSHSRSSRLEDSCLSAAAAGPSIHDMVMQLTQLYCNNNHVLYIDTLFTSPTLVASLFNVGIRVCGSVKRNLSKSVERSVCWQVTRGTKGAQAAC